jgi:hypothetical protein
MNDLIPSLIRTYVPIGVAFIVGLLTDNGVVVSDETSTAAVLAISGVAGAVWYAAARWLEGVNPMFGWLLGSPKTPSY